ncbi:dipeptidase PepV [Halarcobacter ebronensis]|uniref:Dipeptidase PepV n=1 Tax=Halarcobacter ebronensis TaxID=1462615 RepID=A0A4Q0YCT8_9BACT|nr:dipeptidase PepV [Halarcobacter ebronensis]RXJ68230.1 dipeptidase PepV [Halarcobacter ebronensis]
MPFNKLLKSYKDEIIQKTQELIQIKSVESSAKPNMPFGEGVDKALQYTLNLCEKLGFETQNFDGYAGHADLGNSDDIVGVLVHLDVVPEGDEKMWKYPPYSATIENNRIYGRGAIDDKGPTIAAIYAMKALKESGVKLNKKIRIIFGTDEESGWECMNYYLKEVKPPQVAFTPDANYPVIYGEKGILTLDLEKKFVQIEKSHICIEYIKGGELSNMVPNYCEALLILNEDIEKIYGNFQTLIKKLGYNIKLELNNNKLLIKSFGIFAHALEPQKGVNAISQLMILLSNFTFSETINDFFSFYTNKIGMQVDGENLGCKMEDKDSGKLTLNVGVINLIRDKVTLTFNIRYPITKTDKEVVKKINEKIKNEDITLEVKKIYYPLYIPKDSKLVKTLSSVYKNLTNDNTEPLTFAGGTYARALSNAVAFGAVFPNEEIMAHQVNEYINIDSLLKNAQIIATAMYELSNN